MVLRCADPRMIVTLCVVAHDGPASDDCVLFDDSSCGELLPPPLPPPKSLPG